MGFVVGGIAFVLAGLLVFQDVAGIATFLARSRQNMTKPMRRLTDEELRVSPRRVKWVRYSDAALLTVIGVVMLWAGFTQ
jgi:hypothetical protein